MVAGLLLEPNFLDNTSSIFVADFIMSLTADAKSSTEALNVSTLRPRASSIYPHDTGGCGVDANWYGCSTDGAAAGTTCSAAIFLI